MDKLNELVEKAKQSELFTAPRLEEDLSHFLAEQGEHIKGLAAQAVKEKVAHIYFAGSGGSWSNMWSGAYLMSRFTNVPTNVLTSYELIWRDPARLGEGAWVFLASYSGGTEDTVAALRHAKAKGARTLAIVRRHDPPSLMSAEADEVVDYDATALYVLPLATVYLFALEVGRLRGGAGLEPAIEGLYALPPVLGRVYRDSEAEAEKLARQFLNADMLYVIGAGPLYGLAYKFALTVFMENIRIHGSVIESAEFRHGPCEMLERQKADVVFLIGTDESRAMTLRALEFAKRQGARTIVYDLADYAEVHPLLAPFVLLIPLQWFTVYSALLRGITDLDERVYMGKGILAQGEGIWP